jgi:hypothetical protein
MWEYWLRLQHEDGTFEEQPFADQPTLWHALFAAVEQVGDEVAKSGAPWGEGWEVSPDSGEQAEAGETYFLE